MLFRGFQFCLNYSLALVATFILMVVVEELPGLRSSSAVLIIFPLLVAATIEGKNFARENRSKPSGLNCCGAALRMTAVASVVALGLLWLGSVLIPERLIALGASPIDLLGLSAIFIAGVAIPVSRCGYAFGLASELRSQRVLRHAGEDA